MSRSPGDVLAVVGALAAVFAIATCLLVRRQEKRGFTGVEPRAPKVKVERSRPVKEPRVRARAARDVSRPQPEPIEEPVLATSEALPDPRRESLVLNLEAFTDFRSRQ